MDVEGGGEQRVVQSEVVGVVAGGGPEARGVPGEGFGAVEADPAAQLPQYRVGVGAAVVVAQEHDILRGAREDVLECGAPVAEPEAGAIGGARVVTVQPSPEIYGFEVGPEVEVARVLHVAAREFVPGVNLQKTSGAGAAWSRRGPRDCGMGRV